MAAYLPPIEQNVDACMTSLVESLDAGRRGVCDLVDIRNKAERYAGAVRSVLEAHKPFEIAFPEIEEAYRGWKRVSHTFRDTIRAAYANLSPKKNLLVDQTLARLADTVGDDLSARYTQLRAQWLAHLTSHPWDGYLNESAEHVDAEPLDQALNALVRGDDLDSEDALNQLTTVLRHAFVDFIETHPGEFADLEVGLWKRPEIILASDFWGRRKKGRLIDVFKRAGSERFSRAFETIELFYSAPKGAASASPQNIVGALQRIPEGHRARFYRCLMLHPDYEMRRYAVNNVDINSFWKVLTPLAVPCATILSLLEHLVGSSHYTTAQRKVFFDTIYRRLLSVTARSDVLYARGIVRILCKLDFFLEDEYFSRLMTLMEYLEAKERMYNIRDGVIAEYTQRLCREKERVGSRKTEPPNFEDIPLVVLRKIARDGHFWDILSCHPIVKIANETVPHINTPDRALAVVKNHRINQEVARAIGRRRSLFTTTSARLALISNPRTPPGVSVEYLADLGRKDVEALLRRGGLHPELRTILRNRYRGRAL